MRDLAQTENTKIVQRLRMGKSCELYEVEFLRDTAREGLGVLSLLPQGRERWVSVGFLREVAMCSLKLGVLQLPLNLPEKVQGSNWRLEDLEAEQGKLSRWLWWAVPTSSQSL